MRRLSWVACVVVISAAVAYCLTGRRPAVAAPNPPALEGFTIEQVRFDESMDGQKPTPRIPKDWRLVAVANGENSNSNNLWFQAGDGTIYIVQGFTTHKKFIAEQTIERLDPR